MALRVNALIAFIAGSHAIRVHRGSSVSSWEQKTASGCTCFSECKTSRWDKFTCDICTTKRCGKFGAGRRYDLCVYPIQESFEARAWEEKSTWFWTRIIKNTQGLKYPVSAKDTLGGILIGNVHGTFDIFTPEQPKGRGKSIHSVGSVAKVTMDISNSPYTGILANGKHKGFIRMGAASAFNKESEGLTPGIGFKFPRTNMPSGDLVAMHSTDMGQSYNFFASNMSNHIPPPVQTPAIILATKFLQATVCSAMVGLSDLAKYTQTGEDVGIPKFPFKLFFQPTPEAQLSTDPKDPESLGAEMAAKFKKGTRLLTVYACSKPAGAPDVLGPISLDNCGGALKIGSISTDSEATMSHWGDEFFHIRHQRIEEDWKLEPSFRDGSQQVCGRDDFVWTNFKEKGGPKPCVGCMLSHDVPEVLVQNMDGKGKGQKKAKGRTSKKGRGPSLYTCNNI